jgi:hypothetical protein
VVQIGAHAGGVHSFVTYVYTKREINPRASAVNGITKETIKGKPAFKKAFLDFLSWVDGVRKTAQHTPGKGQEGQAAVAASVILCAHNGLRFDFPLMLHEMARHSIPLSALSDHGVQGFFDTLPAARAAFKGLPAYKLGALYEHVTGSAMEGAHDALADTKALHAVVSDSGVRGSGTVFSFEGMCHECKCADLLGPSPAAAAGGSSTSSSITTQQPAAMPSSFSSKAKLAPVPPPAFAGLGVKTDMVKIAVPKVYTSPGGQSYTAAQLKAMESNIARRLDETMKDVKHGPDVTAKVKATSPSAVRDIPTAGANCK